jgi:hypothetical protein
MPDEHPVGEMTLAEIRAELRSITGTPWQSDADGPRRQALWRRLDELVAAGAGSGPEPPPATAPAEIKPNPPDIPNVRTYDPARGVCRCPSEPERRPVLHEFRRHKITNEYVLVCTRCDALWDQSGLYVEG